MVTGKGQKQQVSNRSANVRRSTGRNNVSGAQVSPSPSAQSVKDKAVVFPNIPSCCGCGKLVADDTKALQCDKCMSLDSWKCAECLNLFDDLYDCLVSSANSSIRWFCDKCDKLVMTGHGVQTDRTDQLISVVEKLVTRYEEIEKKLESKSSVEDVLKLDEKINQLEQRLSQRASDVENKLVDIEQHLHREKDSGDMDRDQALSDEDLIKSVVKEEINRKTVEDQDTERRKRNLIFLQSSRKESRKCDREKRK